ncbi:hypothetical protein BY996DRAFT_2126439 [Phakopsora pachyrhizi]|nr:hypothetical protein BY996DRAFT_2126439 [Phakopsora pachyrhizi]
MRNKETRKATKTDEIPQSNLLLSRALIKSLGWSWPPLTGKTVGQCLPQGVIITFRSLDRALQRSLLNFGQQVLRDDITQEEKEKLYRLSWDIRRLLIDTLALIHTPEGFDPSADQFWYFDGSSELIWLRLNPGRLESQESTKEIDYPTSITFSTTHPLEGSGIHPCHPRAEKRTIDVCQAPSEGYWLLGFQDCCNPFHHINFSRLQRFASVRISPHVNTLGMLWLENGRPGPKNRILFQKTASEEDLAMFLWPQFQSLHYKALEKLPETPKIPIFQDDVVEICNEDRLLLFTTCYRSHRVHISLQLTIKFHWASEDKQQAKLKNWSSNYIRTI